MKNINQLKQQLMDIKDNNWSLPSGTDKYELALQLLENIGSIDSELRDGLILELLSDMIFQIHLTDEEVKNLLKLSLSENHLFYNIGKNIDDSVFNRAFTLLIIQAILYRHNQSEDPLLTEEEIKRICTEIIRYTRQEKDTRGYVEIKGWAHSTAHTGDVFSQIANCKEIKKPELIDILEAIEEKVCINHYAYINCEDERLIGAVIKIIEREILNDEEFINWIKSFENIKMTGKYPEDHNLTSNRKNFLSALYFRLKRRNDKKSFIDTIEQVLNNTTPNHFK
ncbi:DUF2785 domain-containing protein [Clostridium estertheticum]|uniref:DUF2785 domain-containing protein n=1 Tax=Clostridium estertheticum TaxID=238834 RepID=UPI0013E913B5|nr:DUF2785 domain-containing protein [Clostridium estertheticum]MBZ9686440.1 DUF2785 domain-containing protein [Clostridium estertheticum]